MPREDMTEKNLSAKAVGVTRRDLEDNPMPSMRQSTKI